MRMRASSLAAALLVSLLFPALHAADGPVHCGIEMRNVLLHVAEGVILQVRTLDGEFISRGAGQPPVFDDPNSYTVKLRGADISMDAASLNALMRQSLATNPSPLKDVTIAIENGALKASGKLQKGVTVPFSMTASVSASPDGSIRLHATKLKAVGVPVKGLLDLVGLDVSSLMKMPPGSALRADGDDLLMDPTALLPPPRMDGKVKAVSVSGDRLVMQLAGAGAPPKRPATLPSPGSRNYLYFYGGSIRFGKLTMSDADMQLIDNDPSTPFDFFPAHYEEQLVAGYSKNTPQQALRTYMPDFNDLKTR